MKESLKAQLIGSSLLPGFSSGVVDYFSFFSSYNDLNNSKYFIFPGFCDVHVHFREPGFSYKEDIKSGSLSAAHGGYTAVCTMPNLLPVPHSKNNLDLQLKAIANNSVIKCIPYGAITVDEMGNDLSDMEEIADYCIAFSDDGKGVQNEQLMKKAMLKAKSLNKMIVAHCEDNTLLFGGYIHDGNYCREHKHKGICSASEYKPIERDLKIVEETNCKYHICHISTKESVELIRQAKKKGLNVSCETAPHYLVMNDSQLQEDGRFKMNPPIRSEADRLALIDGIKDGTIDMIATDHAPHSIEEKSKGLEKSAFGIVGLETAFPVLYTHLVKNNIISLDKLIELLAINPRKIFNIPFDNSFCVWDLESEYKINPNDFLSKGRSTPFENERVFGECLLTVYDNKAVYSK